jgi:hypothetical protein
MKESGLGREGIAEYLETQPGQAEIEYWRLNIEDLWYRFALSFLFKSIVRPCR